MNFFTTACGGPNYLEQVCNEVEPELVSHLSCTEWWQQTTLHCVHLLSNSKSILFERVTYFLFADFKAKKPAPSVLCPAAVPGHPKKFTADDCVALLGGVATECVDVLTDFKALEMRYAKSVTINFAMVAIILLLLFSMGAMQLKKFIGRNSKPRDSKKTSIAARERFPNINVASPSPPLRRHGKLRKRRRAAAARKLKCGLAQWMASNGYGDFPGGGVQEPEDSNPENFPLRDETMVPVPFMGAREEFRNLIVPTPSSTLRRHGKLRKRRRAAAARKLKCGLAQWMASNGCGDFPGGGVQEPEDSNPENFPLRDETMVPVPFMGAREEFRNLIVPTPSSTLRRRGQLRKRQRDATARTLKYGKAQWIGSKGCGGFTGGAVQEPEAANSRARLDTLSIEDFPLSDETMALVPFMEVRKQFPNVIVPTASSTLRRRGQLRKRRRASTARELKYGIAQRIESNGCGDFPGGGVQEPEDANPRARAESLSAEDFPLRDETMALAPFMEVRKQLPNVIVAGPRHTRRHGQQCKRHNVKRHDVKGRRTPTMRKVKYWIAQRRASDECGDCAGEAVHEQEDINGQ